jgi:lipopolysaccharide transport system permease protein|tara:strand:+ start:1032 stop:1826 length:795 start_codon:yes stop_codon:yes gene_type:complete
MLSNLRQLFRYRALVETLVVRELKARYRGSVLGYFWSFVNPLLLLLVFSFVFTEIMPRGEEVDLEPYAVFMFCGLLPWTWFSSSLMDAANALIINGNLIKKVMFPAEILPVVSVISNMVHFLFGMPILIGFLIYNSVPLHPGELLWFPVVVAVQFILTLGLAMVLSALTVHFRDIKDLLANLLTLWMFASPIIYPMAFLSERAKGFMDLNPFAHLAISYQEIFFYDGPFGHWKWLLALAFAGSVLFLVGYWLFDRLRDSFAEEV